MNDIMTKMEGGKLGERNQASVISKAPPCTHSAFGEEGKATPSTPSAFGGEGAATMQMPEIDVRELSDEMLIFWLQKLAPEKYGKAPLFGEDTEMRSPGDAEAVQQRAEGRGQRSGGKDCTSVVAVRNVRFETPGSSEWPESRRDFVPQTAGGESVMREDCPELSHRDKAALSIQSACGGETVQQRAEDRGQRSEKMTEEAEAPAIKIKIKIHPPSRMWDYGGPVKIKTERDFANEVRVQELSEEEAPAFGKDAEMGRPGDAEAMQQRAEGRGQRSGGKDCTSVRRYAGGRGVGGKLNAKVRNNKDSTVSACGGEGKAPPSTQSACVGEAVQQRAEVRGRRSERIPESPESGCGFVLQDTGGELVMRQECPERKKG